MIMNQEELVTKVRKQLPENLNMLLTDNDVLQYYKDNTELFIDIVSSIIISIENSKTIAGQLMKWNIKKNNEFYYVKTGHESYEDFSPIEPCSEFIAYKIGQQLGLRIVPVSLEYVNFLGSNILVSITKSFLQSDEMFRSIRTFLTDKEVENTQLEDIIFNRFHKYKEELYKMIVFDFLVNNIDRHLNNFGFICDELGTIKNIAPIYDNGLSLFGDIESSLLEKDISLLDKKAKSKPFRSKQYKQIKIVPRDYIIYLEDLTPIYEVIEMLPLGIKRKEKIKQLLEIRNTYLNRRKNDEV